MGQASAMEVLKLLPTMLQPPKRFDSEITQVQTHRLS